MCQNSPTDSASLVHSDAMIRRPLRRGEVPQDELAAALQQAADGGMDPHAAAQTAMGMGMPRHKRHARTGAAPPLRGTIAFGLRLAAVDASLLSLDKLLAEALPRRETIKAALPAVRTAIVEKRGTAWQSAVGGPLYTRARLWCRGLETRSAPA